MTFHRQGYQRTILSTSALTESETVLLLFLSVHCDENRQVTRSSFTGEKVAKRLKWGAARVRSTVKRLKEAKLLSLGIAKTTRIKLYELPSEDQLANYNPK